MRNCLFRRVIKSKSQDSIPMSQLSAAQKDLISAAHHEDIEGMQAAVAAGGDMNFIFAGNSPWSRLVSYGHIAVVKAGFELGGTLNTSVFNFHGGHIVATAAGNMSLDSDVLRWALEKVPDPGADILSAALDRAIMRKNLTNVLILLAVGANPSDALHSAVVLDDNIAAALIDAGADPYAPKAPGTLSAIEFALLRGKTHPLAYARLPDGSNAGYVALYNNDFEAYAAAPPLHEIPHLGPVAVFAAQFCNAETLKAVLESADPTAAAPLTLSARSFLYKGGETAFHAYARRAEHNSTILEILISKSPAGLINIPAAGSDMTPIMLAIQIRNQDMAAALLAAGADLNVPTSHGTAGHTAILAARNTPWIRDAFLGAMVNSRLDINVKMPQTARSPTVRGMTVRRLGIWKLSLDLVDLREDGGDYMTY